MKLYYSPGACSLSSHIVLNEGGFSFETEKVDLATKKTESGGDYTAINPNGYVPALVLEDGEVLTEGAAIIQYLADRVPEKKLTPPADTMERYRLQEWLNFISTELHKAFAPLFNPNAPEEWKTQMKDLLARRFDYVSKKLDGKQYLMGDTFTSADGSSAQPRRRRRRTPDLLGRQGWLGSGALPRGLPCRRQNPAGLWRRSSEIHLPRPRRSQRSPANQR